MHRAHATLFLYSVHTQLTNCEMQKSQMNRRRMSQIHTNRTQPQSISHAIIFRNLFQSTHTHIHAHNHINYTLSKILHDFRETEKFSV